VLSRNPGEVEFHQGVREVLQSIGPAVTEHPEYADAKGLDGRITGTDPKHLRGSARSAES
jgi:hypothetical protein